MIDSFGVRQLIGRATVVSRSHSFGFLCYDGGDGAHLFLRVEDVELPIVNRLRYHSCKFIFQIDLV